MEALLQAIDWRAAGLFGVTLARLSGAMLAAPAFSHGAIPVHVKAVLLLLVGAAIHPAVKGALGEPPADAAAWAALAGRELCVGLAIGFAVRLVFAAEELAGQLIATQMGLTLGSIVQPDTDQQTPAVSTLVHALATLLFLAVDAHHAVFRALHGSYALTPPALDAPLGALAERLVLFAGGLFGLAVRIAAPVLAATILANVGLALVARAAPSLNVFSVSFAVTILVGLAVLTLAAPSLLDALVGSLRVMLGGAAAVAGGG